MADRVVKVTLRAEIAQYAQAMNEAAAKTREVGSESEKAAQKREAFQKLGTTMLGVGAAMTAVTLAVAKTGIEYNTLQQTSRAALSTLLGGAQQANAQMDKLDAFARTSPFAKTTFITAQQQMLAFGIESKKVVPYLDAISEAVAAAGGSNQQLGEIAFIMAQISSAGKITAQDLMQLGQRGVNAAELIGSQMGKTGAEIRSAITSGSLDADQALDALAAGMKEKFNGASANVKQTFEGAMDRVRAAWRDLSADLAKPLVDPSGGGALVDFLNWTADILRAVQALPEPVKLAGGAIFAFAGFVALAAGGVLAATPRIIAMKAAFQALSGTMRGFALAGGIAVVALTAVVGIIGAVAAAQADARRKAEEYADTLEEGTNKITAATREMADANLSARGSFLWWEDSSAYEKAEEFGVSLGTVKDAALGSVPALEELRAAQEEATNAVARDRNQGGFQAVELGQRKRLIDSVVSSVIGEAESIEAAIEIKRRQAQADAESAEASKTSAEAYQDEAKAVQDLTDQLTGLIDTINEANGIAQDAITANAKYQSALAGISEEVEKQKKAYEEANGTLDGFNLSLDQNTEAGSKNAASLAEVAAASQNAAKAQFEQDKTTMSAEESTLKYVGTLQKQRQAFIDAAVKAGYNKDEVNKLADSIFKMPSKKDVDVLVDTANAQDKINNFVTLNNGRRVKVFVDAEGGQSYKVGNTWVSPNAEGGIYHNKVKSFASGGFEPGIYPFTAGGLHKFAEEYAEAYISMDPRRRGRSEQVWQRVGREAGFSQSSPNVNVSLEGMSITGRLEIGGDGLATIIDGRIVSSRRSPGQLDSLFA